MRAAPLTAIQGIDRLRPRGGARADHLYDFLNGYRTAAKTAKVRPGTVRVANLPPGTHGLTAFNGSLHVFASAPVDLSAYPEFSVHLLLHPVDATASLTKIHFAEPFMGALYVVAEFSDGQTFHFWLQRADKWEANKEYSANDFVEPGAPNGFVYRATRFGSPYQAWSRGVPREVGDRIEPTAYNEYYYEAVATNGDNPRSGMIEPHWPTNTGQQIVESADSITLEPEEPVTPPAPPPANKPQPPTSGKYLR